MDKHKHHKKTYMPVKRRGARLVLAIASASPRLTTSGTQAVGKGVMGVLVRICPEMDQRTYPEISAASRHVQTTCRVFLGSYIVLGCYRKRARDSSTCITGSRDDLLFRDAKPNLPVDGTSACKESLRSAQGSEIFHLLNDLTRDL